MEFYIGLHRLTLAQHFERCFISVNILRKRRSDFKVGRWIMDSGAFSEVSTYGDFRRSVSEYAEEITRWRLCGTLEMVVCQDYMCEPFILERTGFSVKEHQALTIERYDELKRLTDVPIMPVLQGYFPREYTRHLSQYGRRLGYGMRVGVGSLCKRNAKPREVGEVLEAIKRNRPDLKLHGFGLKITALRSAYIVSLLHSADSMAWSYRARRNGGNANSLIEARRFYDSIERLKGSKPTQLLLTETRR